MSTRQNHQGRSGAGRPSGQAGAGAKSAMEEMMRRAGKQAPAQGQVPRSSQAPARGTDKK
jgi:hypothetical protein